MFFIFRWQSGGFLTEEERSKLSVHELNYLEKYEDLYRRHAETWSEGSHAVEFETDEFLFSDETLTLRILQGNGEEEIMCEGGTGVIKLKEGLTQVVRTPDAEKLLAAGVAEVVGDGGVRMEESYM